MQTLKTKIHTYSFDTTKPAEAAAYAELCTRLRADGRDFFHVLADTRNSSNYPAFADGQEIELETDCLFSNQWNSTTARVFDWYEGIYPNRAMRIGHYLEITDEMRAIREKTLVCGYCGAKYPEGINYGPYDPNFTGQFCVRCFDSEYLKPADLYLLRLLPVALHMPERAALTPDERSQLTPVYIWRQTKGAGARAVARAVKIRADVESKYAKAKETAETEYRGMTWLLDRGVSVDNCIYYNHTQKFSFGWRSPVSVDVEIALRALLAAFPYAYEIKIDQNTVTANACN
jgi:hypothetical protein